MTPPPPLIRFSLSRTHLFAGIVTCVVCVTMTLNLNTLKPARDYGTEALHGTNCGNSIGLPLGRQQSQRSDGVDCWWSFVAYHASEYESKWLLDIEINQEDVCGRQEQVYKLYVDEYIGARRLLVPDQPPSEPPLDQCSISNMSKTFSSPKKLPPRAFSKFEFEWKCHAALSNTLKTFLYIEPLAGVLRHPISCSDNYFVRKDYLLLDGWAIHNPLHQMVPVDGQKEKQRRYFYFDVGASTWTTGAGGASQKWFHHVYKDMCVCFDHYYAWEVAQVRAVDDDHPNLELLPFSFLVLEKV